MERRADQSLGIFAPDVWLRLLIEQCEQEGLNTENPRYPGSGGADFSQRILNIEEHSGIMLKSAPARWLKDPEEPSFLDCLDRFGRHVPKLVDSFNAGLNLGGQGSRSGDKRIFLKRLGEYTALNRSEEHTSELQSLMRISYAVFCLKKKKTTR